MTNLEQYVENKLHSMINRAANGRNKVCWSILDEEFACRGGLVLSTRAIADPSFVSNYFVTALTWNWNRFSLVSFYGLCSESQIKSGNLWLRS